MYLIIVAVAAALCVAILLFLAMVGGNKENEDCYMPNRCVEETKDAEEIIHDALEILDNCKEKEDI